MIGSDTLQEEAEGETAGIQWIYRVVILLFFVSDSFPLHHQHQAPAHQHDNTTTRPTDKGHSCDFCLLPVTVHKVVEPSQAPTEAF